METKYIKYIMALIVGTQLLTACSDDFVEVEPKGKALEDNYYLNAEQAYEGLIAAYDPVGWAGTYVNKTFPLDAASDNFHTGGGHSKDNDHVQVWDKYTLTPLHGPQTELWNKGYSGIYRCNILISKLPGIEMDEVQKATFMAEAKFLRAYYYFDLVRLFERIPLITKPLNSEEEIYGVQQVDRVAVFKQIEEDLKAAIGSLPKTVDKVTEAGRATEGAATALLGKVYLQQDKFGPAAEQFKIVNGEPGGTSEFGYKLMDNFADLWKLENEFNSESIFEISHNSTSNQGWDGYAGTEGNVLSILIGPRNYTVNTGFEDIAPPLVSGWSFLTVTESLVNAFVQGGVYDPRYSSTIFNLDSLVNIGAVSYLPHFENTGYFLAKFAPYQANKSNSGAPVELNFPTNEYEIRLADTYLMEAEAIVRGGGEVSRAQLLLDAVRARVGLDPVPATFENIFNERRLELAGEGHRWFDLVRTDKAAAALAHKGYVEGKHDALPIPLGELEFDNTLLEQDPAYK